MVRVGRHIYRVKLSEHASEKRKWIKYETKKMKNNNVKMCTCGKMKVVQSNSDRKQENENSKEKENATCMYYTHPYDDAKR